jgi:hypothetical protein
MTGASQLNVNSTLFVGGFGTGAFNQSAGNVAVGHLTVAANAGSSGTYNMTGASQLNVNGTLILGNRSTGTFNQSAGNVSVGNQLQLGRAGGNGTYNMNGGSLNLSNSALFVGAEGTGTLNQTAGTISVGSNFRVAASGSVNGTYNMSGGSLALTATAANNSLFIGQSGVGTVNQTGGTVSALGTLNIGLNSGANGLYRLDGGTLQIGAILGGAGTSAFNFNGGNLVAARSTTSFMSGVQNARVQAGGAKIDTNGFNITVAQSLMHDSASAARQMAA